MARTVAEIEADIAARKAAGVHPAKKEMAVLRAELAEAKALLSPPAPSATPSAETASTTTSASTATVFPADDGIDPEEMRFAMECVAGLELPLNTQISGIVSKIYDRLRAQMRVRRILIDVMKQAGRGGEWPQWATLGRDDSTGEPVKKAPVKPTIVRDPEPVAAPPPAPAAGAPVTMEQMMAAMQQMMAKQNDPMEQLKRGVAAEIAKSVKVG